MILRPATSADWELLLQWRNDNETRRNSHNMDYVPEAAHRNWLAKVLASHDRQLLIAMANDTPVGTVRIDSDADSSELSWTVAPEHRGKGYGKQMVQLAMARIRTPIRAEVKAFNTASKKIAEGCGMTLEKESNGVLYYKK